MKYPRHLAIIADGNRTRAQEQWMPTMDGHFAWAQKTLELLEHVFTTTPVEIVTWWFLSTENLKKRTPAEVEFLVHLTISMGNDIDQLLGKYHINFRRAGNPEWLPAHFVTFLDDKAKKLTFPDSNKTAVFCFNYGWRDEIIRGIKSLSSTDIANITEESFAKHLDFGAMVPLDMVIRTKWDTAHRTSGFMSWRIGYAELYFAKEYYPAFTMEKLDESLKRYDSVAEDRNFGK